jgi:hypothetical protein
LVQGCKEDSANMLAVRTNRTATPTDDVTMLTAANDPDVLLIGFALGALNMADQRVCLLAWSDIAHPTLMNIAFCPSEGRARYRPLDITDAIGRHVLPIDVLKLSC